MEPFRAITALGDIEERLRRALGLTGYIGSSIEPAAVPVVLVDDATRAGNNILRGRRFVAGLSIAAAAGTPSISFRNTAPIRIRGVHIGMTITAGNPATANLRVAVPGTADPYAIATTAPWSENAASVTDIAPVVFGSSNVTAGAGTSFATLAGGTVGPGYVPMEYAFNVAGWIFSVTGSSMTGALAVTIFGEAL